MHTISRLLSLGLLLVCASSVCARVKRVEILSRSDVLGGQAFGNSGAYERLTGRVLFEVAVDNAHNQRIVDLANAENLRDGLVEFSADFIALRPKDSAKGNGTLLLENPNRGRPGIATWPGAPGTRGYCARDLPWCRSAGSGTRPAWKPCT
jgi:hypothetical protein